MKKLILVCALLFSSFSAHANDRVAVVELLPRKGVQAVHLQMNS